MSIVEESSKLLTYYDMQWGKRLGIAKKDIKDVLNMICEVWGETNFNIDHIQELAISMYYENNPLYRDSVGTEEL